jgi:GT2 family glycosyltransferase/glycosyltransferase involved in cell wall biosynthesis
LQVEGRRDRALPNMKRLRARFAAYFRIHVEAQLERRKQLLEKMQRDPERFFADARSPYVRRAGEIAARWGWVPAASLDAVRGPRAVPRSQRAFALAHAVSVKRGTLSGVHGNRLRGTATSGSDLPVALVARLDGEEIARFVAVGAFDVCVDLGEGYGNSATLDVACAATGVALEGSPRTITVPRYEGALSAPRRGRLRGYIRDVATGAPVFLDVIVDGRVAASLCVGADARRTRPLPLWFTHAFAVRYDARRTDATTLLRVRGTDRGLFGTPLPFDAPVIRKGSSALPQRNGNTSSRRVHVVIPVYSGHDVTLRCVDSVVRARNTTDAHVTVFWDAGPDTRLRDALRSRALSGAFSLVENRENLGFLRTCNRGMSAHPDDDVVLLKADTEVADGWLDRLARAARSSPDIGTATPFSNAATICTYPKICSEAPLPSHTTVAQLDTRFARVNTGEVLDLPTGHGFCLFIRRAMLDLVGPFDETDLGFVCGEESDLCLRGRAAGFRSVLAADVFVGRAESVSFGAERSDRASAALSKLAARHPAYTAEMATFIRNDPAEHLRNRVVVATLRELVENSPRGSILMVTHHLGGGVEVNVRALGARLEQEGICVLELASHPDGTLRLRDVKTGLEATYLERSDLESTLVRDLEALGLRLVHVHHILTFPETIRAVLAQLNVPFDVTLHDFFATCPRVNLVRADGTYCGEPPPVGCDICIATDGPHEAARILESSPPTCIASYRESTHSWLSRARRIVVPSSDTAARINRVFPALALDVLPHPETGCARRPRVATPDGIVHVAVLGGIGLHKGFRRLLDVARCASNAGLPLRFVVFGTTVDSGSLRALPNVEVSGRYTSEQLPALIARTRCTVAAFLSVWPETYSYTLSEALELGLYPVCNDIGAPAERLRALDHGILIPTDAAPAEVCAALLDAARRAERSAMDGVPLSPYDDVIHQYYRLEGPR